LLESFHHAVERGRVDSAASFPEWVLGAYCLHAASQADGTLVAAVAGATTGWAYTGAVTVETEQVSYLLWTLVWMGGHTAWSEEMIAEQIGFDDDPRIPRDLAIAEQVGLISRTEGLVGLTERGWEVVAEDC
jgi:hypothetical protein